MSMSYAIIEDKRDPDAIHHRLTAKTDKAARAQAKKIADEKGWGSYTILFFRSEDGCRGELSR